MTKLTMNPPHTDLFRHHKLNTILTAANWPYQVNSVFDGKTLLAAYGWSPDLSDEEILEKVRALNFERSRGESSR